MTVLKPQIEYLDPVPINVMAGPSGPTDTYTINHNPTSTSSSNASTGMLVSQGIAMVGQVVTGILGALSQMTLMRKQSKMQKGALDHQENVAEINSDMAKDSLNEQEKRQVITEKYTKHLQKSEEELKEVKDEIRIADAELAETEKTNKAGDIDDNLVSSFFDNRNEWDRGNPDYPC